MGQINERRSGGLQVECHKPWAESRQRFQNWRSRKPSEGQLDKEGDGYGTAEMAKCIRRFLLRNRTKYKNLLKELWLTLLWKVQSQDLFRMLETRRAHDVIQSGGSMLKTQEEPTFSFEEGSWVFLTFGLKDTQAGEFPLSLQESQPFLFCPGLELIGWGPPASRRAICSIHSTNSNVLQKHPHRQTKDTVRQNVWAPGGPVRLTHKINQVVNRLEVEFTQEDACRRGVSIRVPLYA